MAFGIVKTAREVIGTQARPGANPKASLGGGYMKNCQIVVMAVEMRVRGYDFVARPNNSTLARKLSYSPELAFIDPATSKAPEVLEYRHVGKSMVSSQTDFSELGRAITAKVKPLKRYCLQWQWVNQDGTTCEDGHIVNLAASAKGQAVLIDGQTGRTVIDMGRLYQDYFRYTGCHGIDQVQIFQTSGMAITPEYFELLQRPDEVQPGSSSKAMLVHLKKVLQRIRI